MAPNSVYACTVIYSVVPNTLHDSTCPICDFARFGHEPILRDAQPDVFSCQLTFSAHLRRRYDIDMTKCIYCVRKTIEFVI